MGQKVRSSISDRRKLLERRVYNFRKRMENFRKLREKVRLAEAARLGAVGSPLASVDQPHRFPKTGHFT